MESSIRSALRWAQYDEDHPSSTSDIFCRASQAKQPPGGRKTRGLTLGEKPGGALTRLMAGPTQAILDGLRARGDGEIEVADGVFFEHLMRREFETLRELHGVSRDAFLTSLAVLEGGATQQAGKSGSLFWFSGDGAYILKSATKKEVEKLTSMLPAWIDHVRAASTSGRPCLLPAFFGAYRLRSGTTTLSVVAQNNVFEGAETPSRVYDLKGTTEDRFVRPRKGNVLKDLNFWGHEICLRDEAQVNRLVAAADEDSLFLEAQGIMDYSLLLGVYDGSERPRPHPLATYCEGLEVVTGDAYAPAPLFAWPCGQGRRRNLSDEETEEYPAGFRIGIIDVLVEYNLKKKAAHWLKKSTIGCCQEIDTEPPDIYQQRFMDCFEEIFVVDA